MVTFYVAVQVICEGQLLHAQTPLDAVPAGYCYDSSHLAAMNIFLPLSTVSIMSCRLILFIIMFEKSHIYSYEHKVQELFPGLVKTATQESIRPRYFGS